jgi:hypothetical protein
MNNIFLITLFNFFKYLGGSISLMSPEFKMFYINGEYN